MSATGIDHQSGVAAAKTGRREMVDRLTRHLANPVAVEAAATDLLAEGWRPPAATVDELEALPVRTVVTDPDGHVWVRNRVGEWCEPYPAGIEPIELWSTGPSPCIARPGTSTGPAGSGRSGVHDDDDVRGLVD